MPVILGFFHGLKIFHRVGVCAGHVNVIILGSHLRIMNHLVNVVRVNAPRQRVPEFVFDEPVRAVHDVFVELEIVHSDGFACVGRPPV